MPRGGAFRPVRALSGQRSEAGPRGGLAGERAAAAPGSERARPPRGSPGLISLILSEPPPTAFSRRTLWCTLASGGIGAYTASEAVLESFLSGIPYRTVAYTRW